MKKVFFVTIAYIGSIKNVLDLQQRIWESWK